MAARGSVVRLACRAASAFVAVVFAACGGDEASSTGESAGGEGGTGSSRAAFASLRYALEDPTVTEEYPYGVDQPGPAARVGATVYVSAAESSVGGDEPFGVLWSVVAPGGRTLELAPAATSVAAAFVVRRAGEHTVALRVASVSDAAAVAGAVLRLNVDARTCSPDGAGAACEQSLPVPGGAFSMGSSTADGHSSEHPEHAAAVAEFALDRFEVTVGRFRRFLDENGVEPPLDAAGAHPLIAGSGWRSSWNTELPVSREQLLLAFHECAGTFTPEVAAREALPVNCVSWYEAFAFCAWDGGRLPTEAEWEHVASGGAEDRTYPWGDAVPEPSLAVFDCAFDGSRGCSDADLAPVGNAPAGKGSFGHEDLAGSVWEWVLDRYAAYSEEPCDNCAAMEAGEGRVFRGGDFTTDDRALLRAATRLGFLAEYRDPTRGFRCARSAPR